MPPKHGKGPSTTKWSDINKGDDCKPKYRSRNVAGEIARKKQDGLFAATPPLEVMKLLLSPIKVAEKTSARVAGDAHALRASACRKRARSLPRPRSGSSEGRPTV